MKAALLLHVANLASTVGPTTRGFAFRAALYRAGGVLVAPRARIVGGTKIHYPNVSIGESWIGSESRFYSAPGAHIQIGDRCDIGPGVVFVVGSHEIGGSERRAGAGRSASIRIGDGTWVGARCTFLGGSAVGSGCVVAAGSLVLDVFPNNVLIAGHPARVVRRLP